MEKKKNNIVTRRLKRKIVLGITSIMIFFSPILFILLLVAEIVPAAEESVVADYKTAAEAAGCSWQELIAFDTVRYENDFESADPNQSALDFLTIYYELYREETITKNGVTKTRWVLDKSGWLSTPNMIRDFFKLSQDAGVAEITTTLSGYASPQYVISIHTKDIEDVIVAHDFDQDQVEWVGALLTEELLNEMYGDLYELPDFIIAGNGYFGWPVPGIFRITDTYGPRIHPVTGKKSYHYGVDIGAPEGTPVVAIEEGIITGASHYGGTAGVNVRIQHEKDGYVWESKYFHLSQIQISVGDRVERGTVIAASGNTGRSTGPHLHIGITMNGVYVDPLPLITENSD
ncbi:MAG: M23 family metallopeptidase [Eubacteriales bacterium]|nr:M23 family metallopeptidase [Eubacteriales bacterium]